MKSKIKISIPYIPGKKNIPAEKELNQKTFNELNQNLPFSLSTDLFSIRTNFKLPLYVTSIPGSSSRCIFPPPFFINKILYKLRKTPPIHHIIFNNFSQTLNPFYIFNNNFLFQKEDDSLKIMTSKGWKFFPPHQFPSIV